MPMLMPMPEQTWIDAEQTTSCWAHTSFIIFLPHFLFEACAT